MNYSTSIPQRIEKPKLLTQVRQVFRTKHYNQRTEEVQWVDLARQG